MAANGRISVEGYWVNLVDKIGHGTFGVVYSGENKDTGKLVAAKQCDISAERGGSGTLTEIKNLQYLQTNGHVVRLLNFYYQTKYIWIIMEHCDSGNLETFYIKNNPSLQQSIDFMYHAACGIHFMHSQESPIIHRDIKPGNLLVTTFDDHKIIKICDFGLATADDASMSKSMMLSTKAGASAFLAPECFLRKKYDTSVDIFALGLVYNAITMFKPGDNALKPLLPDGLMLPIGAQMANLHQQKIPLPAYIQNTESDSAEERALKSLQRAMIQFESCERFDSQQVLAALEQLGGTSPVVTPTTGPKSSSSPVELKVTDDAIDEPVANLAPSDECSSSVHDRATSSAKPLCAATPIGTDQPPSVEPLGAVPPASTGWAHSATPLCAETPISTGRSPNAEPLCVETPISTGQSLCAEPLCADTPISTVWSPRAELLCTNNPASTDSASVPNAEPLCTDTHITTGRSPSAEQVCAGTAISTHRVPSEEPLCADTPASIDRAPSAEPLCADTPISTDRAPSAEPVCADTSISTDREPTAEPLCAGIPVSSVRSFDSTMPESTQADPPDVLVEPTTRNEEREAPEPDNHNTSSDSIYDILEQLGFASQNGEEPDATEQPEDKSDTPKDTSEAPKDELDPLSIGKGCNQAGENHQVVDVDITRPKSPDGETIDFSKSLTTTLLKLLKLQTDLLKGLLELDDDEGDQTSGSTTAGQFEVGDEVYVLDDEAKVKELQHYLGGWVDQMAKYVGKKGVVDGRIRNMVVVAHEDGEKIIYNPLALLQCGEKYAEGGVTASGRNILPTHNFKRFDIVKMSAYPEIMECLQGGHGGFVDKMLLACGVKGMVNRIDADRDAVVEFINGDIWTVNPELLVQVDTSLHEIEQGDFVVIVGEHDSSQALQENMGLWHADMTKKIGHSGIVKEIHENSIATDMVDVTYNWHKSLVKLVAKKDELFTAIMERQAGLLPSSYITAD